MGMTINGFSSLTRRLKAFEDSAKRCGVETLIEEAISKGYNNIILTKIFEELTECQKLEIRQDLVEKGYEIKIENNEEILIIE